MKKRIAKMLMNIIAKFSGRAWNSYGNLFEIKGKYYDVEFLYKYTKGDFTKEISCIEIGCREKRTISDWDHFFKYKHYYMTNPKKRPGYYKEIKNDWKVAKLIFKIHQWGEA